jgi:hypothetical protein
MVFVLATSFLVFTAKADEASFRIFFRKAPLVSLDAAAGRSQ